ncbi:MAG: ribonuclease P protein component [Gammaproteobacteria bacterium]
MLNLGSVISKKIYHSDYASIFFDVESKNQKLKIVVKKKDYSLAVHRNKIKRWTKEIFRKSLMSEGFVVVVRRGFLEAGFKKISCDFGLALDNFVNSSQDD